MIREMTLDDLEIVCEMELRLFSSPWPRESYELSLIHILWFNSTQREEPYQVLTYQAKL